MTMSRPSDASSYATISKFTITLAAQGSAVATTTTITAPNDFNTDLHNGTNAGTLSATVTAEGNAISSATVTWSSSNTGVATIAANGAVTLVAAGTTTITASYAGVEDQYRPSSATYELTVIDSYAPGSENNPYTVAQAIANTPSGGNVYIHGIVSSFYNTSIVGDGNNYRYYISDDGTTTTQLVVYKGTGLNHATFTNANDLLVGDEVVICGTLNTYNNAPQVASGNYLYSWNRPAAAVEAPTFSPVAGTYASAQTVSMNCTTSGAAIYYTTDGSTPDANSTRYTADLTVSTTTTFKAIAIKDGVSSVVTTATYHINSQANSYTVTQALAFLEYPANGIYVHGIVSTAPTSNPSSGKLTYYISVDGETSNQLQVYKGKNLNNEDFTSKDDIQVGDIVTVFGDVKIYNGTKEFDEGNYLVSFERPTTPAQDYTLTIANPSNVTITAVYGTDGVLTNGDSDDIESGTEIAVTVNVASGYVLDALTVTGVNNQTVTVTENNGVYTFNMPAFDATISATLAVATTGTYTLATSIESGKQYIIVGQSNSVYYAMSYDRTSNGNRAAAEISVSADKSTATANIANTGVHEFTITSLGGDYYSIMDATTNGGYLYAASTSSNQLKTEATLDENHNGDWKITVTNGTNVSFSVVADRSSNRNVMQFNNSNTLFSCYASASQHAVYLYQKVEPQTYNLDITGYGTNPNVKSGWYLISSPIGTVNPANVTNMLGNEYDLYRFNQSAALEWENYKGDESLNFLGGFSLEAGHGYLYANSGTSDNNNVTLTFTGTPYNQTGSFDLVYSTANTDENMHGWNLMGNPFPSNAKVSKSFYKMNSTSDGINADPYDANSVIASMEGVFVLANQGGETVTFTATNDPVTVQPSRSINLYVNRNGEMLDRAVVSFNTGGSLCKLVLSDNTTKLYFRQGQKDYAIIASPSENEVPVNFKASRNGRYTITVNPEDVEMNYLHLIDNMTGANVDLLATPSYSFEATTTDYASRFRLVFSAISSEAENDIETFAYFNGNDWMVSNEGEANLQVIDLTGRILSNETINGMVAKTITATPGIYMLRLVNNNEVKTQKILVK